MAVGTIQSNFFIRSIIHGGHEEEEGPVMSSLRGCMDVVTAPEDVTGGDNDSAQRCEWWRCRRLRRFFSSDGDASADGTGRVDSVGGVDSVGDSTSTAGLWRARFFFFEGLGGDIPRSHLLRFAPPGTATLFFFVVGIGIGCDLGAEMRGRGGEYGGAVVAPGQSGWSGMLQKNCIGHAALKCPLSPQYQHSVANASGVNEAATPPARCTSSGCLGSWSVAHSRALCSLLSQR